MNNTHIHTNNESGSFLIELLVAFAIISIAMTVIVDSFITSQHAYYLTSEQGKTTGNLTLFLEDITREARVSHNFSFNASTHTFTMNYIEGLNGHVGNEVVEYIYNPTTKIINKRYYPIPPPTSPDYTVSITPTNIEVSAFNVNIVQNLGQSTAVVTLTANSKEEPGVEVSVQTSFTQRDL